MHGAYPTGKAYRELLMSYDGLVLPSQATEGLPLVLLEAAAVGLPILTTSIGGIPDFTENNLDVQVVGLGVDSLHHGLYRFINSIQYGGFSCSRHRKFFQQNYSFPVLESQWMVMLQNPRLFFHGFPT
jgi:glycosyltransferase involved in cell wall biosynthesis